MLTVSTTPAAAPFPASGVGLHGRCAYVREGPQETWAVRYKAERPVPIHPAIIVTFSPRRRFIQATQSYWSNALRFLLGVPDWSQHLVHHRIATDDVTRDMLEEKFDIHILELF
jgi:hypothetical protein